MTDRGFIEIHWTCGSIDEARKVSRYLVQERLAACAQISPWIESIYLWDGKMETEQETKVVIKSRLLHFEAIKRAILENCKYELPEILLVPIQGGHEPYLDWIEETTVV